MFNRDFYTNQKRIIDDISEKLINFFADFETISSSDINKDINSLAKINESKVIYTNYANSFDPRSGQMFVVYIPKLNNKTSENQLLECLKKHFGQYVIRHEKDCKTSTYRTYNKNALDIVFENEINFRTKLNIIINDNFIKDMEKYEKFLQKTPNNVLY